jgi:very-short-patch-repair endonuclease
LTDDSELVAERINRLRTKLLDLTTTNRMLAFRHPKASCLRVVDKLPGHLMTALLAGETLMFEAVPEPTTRELGIYAALPANQVPRGHVPPPPKRPDAATWARRLGFNVDYDLPVETDSFERPDRHADRNIQTLHYPDELDARLRKIRGAGRTAIEESGANMLYLAFGFLEWRDQQTSKAYQAPLVLMPVELEREPVRSGQYRTRVRWTHEELQTNLSLRKKLEEFNIALPEIEDDQSLENYLTEVTRATRHKPDWLVRRYVTLGLFEFGKILLYLDLDPARWPVARPLAEHRLVRQILIGGEEQDESGGAISDPDMSPAAMVRRDLKLELVDRADSSQCEALEVALSGRDLVVQGPPGTGKSQTITNLVAAALARGKTVLFVAEKLAALEVVRRRLRELGLGDFCLELHSHKTRKLEVLQDIADRYRAAAHLRPPAEYETALTRLESRRAALSAYIDTISGPAGGLAGLTVGAALMRAGRARRKLGASVTPLEAIGPRSPETKPMDWARLADAKGRLEQLAAAVEELGHQGTIENHPWAGVSATHVMPHDHGRLSGLLSEWARRSEIVAELSVEAWASIAVVDQAVAAETFAALGQHRSAAGQAEAAAALAERALGRQFARSSKGALELKSLIEAAFAAPLAAHAVAPAYAMEPGASDWLTRHAERLQMLKAGLAALEGCFRSDAFQARPDDLEEWSAALRQRGLFVPLGDRWRAASKAWKSLVRPNSLKIPAKEKAERLAQLRAHLMGVAAWSADTEAAARLGKDAANLDFDTKHLAAVAAWADLVRSTLPRPLSAALLSAPTKAVAGLAEIRLTEGVAGLAALKPATEVADTFWLLSVDALVPTGLQHLVAEAHEDEAWSQVCAAAQTRSDAVKSMAEAELGFKEATGLKADLWFGKGIEPTPGAVASRARLALADLASLDAWLAFDRIRTSCAEELEGPLVEACLSGLVEPRDLALSLDFLVYDRLAREAFRDHPALLQATRTSLEATRAEYAALDAQVMELRRAQIAATLVTAKPPAGRQSAVKSELTESALLRAELAKQRRHVPIRQLMKRAGRSIQVLKPCFMMGPLSVAQYIEPGGLKFDLVIMDEASQMRPEDAIGALARGGQAVIVGDSKQLPPTSFFERISDGRDGDDDGAEDGTLAEDTKSILELGEAIFDQRLLRWHYRSRHQALIAFSNKHFYKNELIIFPSPAGQSDRFGLGWTFVADGAATGGLNPAEARIAARAAAEFLLDQPGRSLGVVAMNIRQAQRIGDELASIANREPLVAAALAKAENDASGEPFFIKNLENVQGDERDVIMISMTYGPPTVGGRTPQNFGPINRDTGWRRLNVLFTRAKERMEIISSMRSTDVVPKEGTDRGPRALKLFLEYAETGRLGDEPKSSGRPTGSDFEDAVLEGLRELGFDCEPQLGVANFFLDIAIRDPGAPDEFVVAIECDGASYHSTKSARDRDRLRQEILENLGWEIRRLWSTDWFRNPQGELERLAREIRTLIAARAERRARIVPKPGRTASPAPDVAPRMSATPAAEPANTGDLVERMGRRASSGISMEQARAQLVDLRERTIKAAFPDADPMRGFLRKTMLDELLRKRPTDLDEFRQMIPLDLRQRTDAEQVKAFQENVFEILANLDG